MTHPGTTGATALVVADAQPNMLVGAGAAPEAAELRGVLGERVVHKSVSDTFAANPPLAAELWSAGVRRLVVVGLQSEHCVRATSLGALDAGFAVLLPS